MSDADREGGSATAVTDAVGTIVSGGALVFVSKVVALPLGFLTQFVMARWLLADEYGSVVLAIAVVTIAIMLAKLGLDDGMMRKVPEFEDHRGKLRGVVRAGVRVGAVSGLAVAVSLFVFAPTIAEGVFDDPSLTPLLRIGAAAVPFMVVGKILVFVARGLRAAGPYAYVYQLLRMAGRFVFVAALVLGGFGAVGAMLGQTLALIVTGIAGAVAAVRLLPSWDGAPPVRMDRHLLAFSLPLIAMQGMDYVIVTTDTFVIGYVLPSEQVGVYNISFQLRNGLITVLVACGFLLPPILTRLQVDGRPAELRTVYAVVTKWVVFLTLPPFLVLFAFPEAVLGGLFGAAYADGAAVLRVLAVGGFAAATMGATDQSLIGLDRNRLVMYTTGAAAVGNLALNIALVPTIGILGAAIASTGAIVCKNVANLWFLRRDFGIVPLTRGGATATVAALGTAAGGYVLIVSALPAAVVALAWLSTYPLVVVAFGGIDAADRRLYVRLGELAGRELPLADRYGDGDD